MRLSRCPIVSIAQSLVLGVNVFCFGLSSAPGLREAPGGPGKADGQLWGASRAPPAGPGSISLKTRTVCKARLSGPATFEAYPARPIGCVFGVPRLFFKTLSLGTALSLGLSHHLPPEAAEPPRNETTLAKPPANTISRGNFDLKHKRQSTN